MPFKTLARMLIGIGCISWLTSCGLLAPKPEPCNCSRAETELRALAVQLGEARMNEGALRQDLKACNEKR